MSFPQLFFYLRDLFVHQGIEIDRDGAGCRQYRREDAEHEPDACHRQFALRFIGDEAEQRENKSGKPGADSESHLLCELQRRKHESGGPPPGFPLAIVRCICIHGPDQRRGGSNDQGPYDVDHGHQGILRPWSGR